MEKCLQHVQTVWRFLRFVQIFFRLQTLARTVTTRLLAETSLHVMVGKRNKPLRIILTLSIVGQAEAESLPPYLDGIHQRDQNLMVGLD